MKALCCILILLLPSTLFSQAWQWSKQIGGPGRDEALIGHVDLAGNVYLYGSYAYENQMTNYSNCYFENDTLFGSEDAFLAKYDANGNLLWVKNCVSPSGQVFLHFAFDQINDVFYVSGVFDYSCTIDTCSLNSGYPQTGFLAKLNSSGNCLWIKKIAKPASFATTYGEALTVDDNGFVYVAGNTNGYDTIGTSAITAGTFLAKFDSDGNNIWAKTKFSFTLFQSQISFNSLRCFDNNIIACGNAYAVSTSDTIQTDTIALTNLKGTGFGLVCIDASTGTSKWMKFEGHPHTLTRYPMMDIDAIGNIYCTGTFYDTCIFSGDTLMTLLPTYSVNGFLTKYDISGNMLWIKQLNSTIRIGCSGICVQPDQSILTVGTFAGQATFDITNINASASCDMFISHHDNNTGNCIGVDHAGKGEGRSVVSDGTSIYVTGIFPASGVSAGNIILGSNTFITNGWEDIFIAKHEMLTAVDHIERSSDNNLLVIYANPNKGSFRLKIPEDFANERELMLRIFDVNGKLIRQLQMKLNEEHPKLDIFGEPAGTYSVTLSNNKKVYRGKMIVE